MLVLFEISWKNILTLDWKFNMEQHVCIVCGHIHDEETEGKWDELAWDFECPECGCGKDEYEIL